MGTTTPLHPDASYDYIICGAGCAGLSLVMHLIQSGASKGKQILLIDKDPKQTNDRTWCFWEKGAGLFEPIVHKKWDRLRFYAPGFEKDLRIQPYTYKLVRGLHFYRYCMEAIGREDNIHFLQATVQGITPSTTGAAVTADNKQYTAHYVFTSIIAPPQLAAKDIWMLQHFKGWYIKTEHPVFNPSVGTLMDFRTPQPEGATFFYVLPFTETTALVEYTLFSPKKLDSAEYDAALHHYISQQLGIDQYTIEEVEFGIIPMTTFSFSQPTSSVIPIGTAGGYTKGSSGYTFQFIQKSAAAIAKKLGEGKHPGSAGKSHRRFAFYDAVLLNVLHHRRMEGAAVFTRLFKKNNAAKVLQFLDNESSFPQELQIIASLPVAPFTKAAIAMVS